MLHLIPSSKSQVTVDPPFAPLNKGGWGDRNAAPIVQNGISRGEPPFAPTRKNLKKAEFYNE